VLNLCVVEVWFLRGLYIFAFAPLTHNIDADGRFLCLECRAACRDAIITRDEELNECGISSAIEELEGRRS